MRLAERTLCTLSSSPQRGDVNACVYFMQHHPQGLLHVFRRVLQRRHCRSHHQLLMYPEKAQLSQPVVMVDLHTGRRNCLPERDFLHLLSGLLKLRGFADLSLLCSDYRSDPLCSQLVPVNREHDTHHQWQLFLRFLSSLDWQWQEPLVRQGNSPYGLTHQFARDIPALTALLERQLAPPRVKSNALVVEFKKALLLALAKYAKRTRQIYPRRPISPARPSGLSMPQLR